MWKPFPKWQRQKTSKMLGRLHSPQAVRLSRLRRLLRKVDTAGWLISSKENIVYLTGLTGEAVADRQAYLLVAPKIELLLASPLSQLKPKLRLRKRQFSSKKTVSEFIKELGVKTLAVEETDLTIQEFRQLKTRLKGITLVDGQRRVENLRLVKDATEQKWLKRSAKIASLVMKQAIANLREGVTETAVAHAISQLMLQAGANEMSFPPIVAFGSHSAVPHQVPTGRRLKQNEVVLIDLGAKVNDYCSDMTRTIFWAGSPTPEFRRVEIIVKQAYRTALTTLANGKTTAAKVDAAARKVISQAGFGDNFIHNTGHGIGLSIHEDPSLSARDSTKLVSGMVVTVEPGVYIPGKFGYRFENTIMITNRGFRTLTS